MFEYCVRFDHKQSKFSLHQLFSFELLLFQDVMLDMFGYCGQVLNSVNNGAPSFGAFFSWADSRLGKYVYCAPTPHIHYTIFAHLFLDVSLSLHVCPLRLD